MAVTRSLRDDCSREYADTYLNTDEFSYTWTIHNFDKTLFESYRRNLKSPKFLMRHNSMIITWWISFIEKREFDKSQRRDVNTIDLALIGHVSEQYKIVTKFQFTILHQLKEKMIKKYSSEISHLCQPGLELIFGQFPICISSKELIEEGFCPMGKLVIECNIVLLNEQIEMNDQQIPNCQLSDRIITLLGSKKFSDVKLIVNGKEFYAHKFMLSARSSVFAAVLKHRMMENINSAIEVKNIDDKVFEEVLRYIYTGQISSVTVEMAMKLLVPAAKYNLYRLRITYEVFISKNLTEDNVIDSLIVADVHRLNVLKQQALKFIGMHMEALMNTNRYKSMCKSHPHLQYDCFNAWMVA